MTACPAARRSRPGCRTPRGERVRPRNELGRPPGEDRPAEEIAIAHAAKLDNGSSLAIVRPSGPWRVDDLPEAIARRIIVHLRSGCWVWTGRVDRDGYGRIGNEGVHRVVYRLLVGPIPADRPNVDHVAAAGCIFRRCCFPGHLEPATTRENALRGRSFAALNAAKVACDHGHPFDAANTYRRPNGHRDCRTCVRRRVAAYQRRQRAALARAA